MPEYPEAQGERREALEWLPPGVVRCQSGTLDSGDRPDSEGRPDSGDPSDPRCLSVAASQLRQAPVGRVAVAATSLASPLRHLGLAGRVVEVLPHEEMASLGSPPNLAGCVLDGLLERAEHPAALLARAYERLTAGGVLVLTVRDVRNPSAAKRAVAATQNRKYLFPGETVAALLFHAGFEQPRFFPCGPDLVVAARRSKDAPPWRRRQRLSVIMPVFNERNTFAKTMELVLAKEIPDLDIEIIVVESNSTDGTRDDVLGYSGTPRVEVILEDAPRGKGHAVRRALEAASGDFILIQDADLEYDIDDYESLLLPLRQCEVGFVLGIRSNPDGSWGMRKFGQNTTMSHIMNVGHLVFLALFNLVYRQKLRDPFTMYKLFRRDCLEGLTFECDRFDFDWELTAKLIRAGYHPRELPASYHSRSFSEGKKVTLLRDPLTWIKACFRYRFSRLHSYR